MNIESGIKNIAKQCAGRLGAIIKHTRNLKCRHCGHTLKHHDWNDGLTCNHATCLCVAFGFPKKPKA